MAMGRSRPRRTILRVSVARSRSRVWELGGDAAEPQHLAQRMAGGGGIQHPRGRQLGRRLEHDTWGAPPPKAAVAGPRPELPDSTPLPTIVSLNGDDGSC